MAPLKDDLDSDGVFDDLEARLGRNLATDEQAGIVMLDAAATSERAAASPQAGDDL